MSVDKLEQSSVKDTFDREYILRIVLVAVIIVGALIGGLLYFADSEPEPSGDESFNVQYSDVGVLITQTSGDAVKDNVKLRVNYRNGEQTMKDVSIDELHETEIAIISQETYQVESSEIVWVNDDEVVEVLTEQPLTDNYTPEEPTVNSEDVNLRVGESVQLNADTYVESKIDITDYRWSISRIQSGVPQFVPGGEEIDVIESESAVLSFDEPGVYTAELEVSDEIDNTATGTFDITVESPSLFTDSEAPNQVPVGESFSIDGTEMTTTEVTDYTWSVGDAQYNSPTMTHTFEDSGSKELELTVQDSFGYEETKTFTVEAVSEDSLQLSYDKGSTEGVQFNADTTEVSVDEYEWDFGNGDETTTEDSTTTYSYDADGSYTVTVTAITASGSTLSDTTSVSIDGASAVEIEMASNLGNAWTVESVSGASTDDVLPNDSLGDQNPDIRLEEGKRYVFTGLTDEHQVEFRDLFGDAVLTPKKTTPYEENADWVVSDGSVAFTMTDDLSSVIDGYQSTSDSVSMDGQIVIDSSEDSE